ncbi:MAG: hypothetical protein OEV59_01250 [Deltaproteobacteria bacterium]|nr:hypothetical protein [Deltaproteobacteria bacterium]
MTVSFIRKGLPLVMAAVLLFLAAPLYAADDDLRIIEVKKFVIAGNVEVSEAEIERAIAEFKVKKEWETKKFYTIADLKAVADAITAYYHSKGMMLARAYVPAQQVDTAIVTIAVLEGNLGTLNVSATMPEGVGKGDMNLDYYSPRYVMDWFDEFEGKVVSEDEIESAVLLANRTPGLHTRAVLSKGEEPGSTDVLISAEDKTPVSLTLEYNNYGNKEISRDRYGAYLSLTDPFIGSTFSGTYFVGNPSDSTTYMGIDYSIPVADSGTRVGVRYIKADYIVGEGPMVDLGIEGKSDIFGGYISHPFIVKRLTNFTVTLGYDRKHMFEYVLKEQLTNDDLAVGYLRFDYDRIDSYNGKTIFSLTYSHGFPDFAGSLPDVKEDPNQSRLGANGEFEKASVDIARIQRAGNVLLLLKLAGQFSAERLVTPEMFAIGGPGSVRGYNVATCLGDAGYAATFEVTAPLIPFSGNWSLWGFRVGDMLRIAAFADNGGVRRNNLYAGENKNDDLTGVGVGLRIDLFDRIEATGDVAAPVRSRSIRSDDRIYTVMARLKLLKF